MADKPVGFTTLEEAHEFLREEASWMANKIAFESSKIPRKWKGFIFTPDNRGLALRVDPFYERAPQRVLNEYRLVAKQALHQALVENGDLVGGLIVGLAKQGQNYFDTFGDYEPKQLF
jgi:hypothetical protein